MPHSFNIKRKDLEHWNHAFQKDFYGRTDFKIFISGACVDGIIPPNKIYFGMPSLYVFKRDGVVPLSINLSRGRVIGNSRAS